MYKVIGAVRTRAFRVMWMLEELCQDYEVVPATPASDEARQFNPLGKIPALVDGDAVLTDSVAIMTYLGDKHGTLTAPAGTPDRAQQDALTLWLIDEFDALLWTHAKHTRILPDGVRVPQIEPGLHAEYTRSLAGLEARLTGDFLMGDKITIPDLLATHCLGWGFSAGFPEMSAKVKDYSKRMRARPAFRAAGGR
ncbi:MAG: glutathione S-transferase [Pseudomonadota bacterium]